MSEEQTEYCKDCSHFDDDNGRCTLFDEHTSEYDVACDEISHEEKADD
jgi:hypothetical protein